MPWNQPSEKIAHVVHRKSVEILSEVGFCVPDGQTLADLKSAGFITDDDSQMVRITDDLLDEALSSLPGKISLYQKGSQEGLDFKHRSYSTKASSKTLVVRIFPWALKCLRGRFPRGHNNN